MRHGRDTTKSSKVSQKQSYRPTSVDQDILELLYKWRYVTSDQIRRYRKQSSNSLHDIQHRLKNLVAHGYVYASHLWRDTSSGRLPFVYTLDTNGVNFLADRGMEIKKYVRKDRKPDPTRFPHNLAVNEVALAAKELEKHAPHITLHKVLHDWELKREKYRVTLYRNTATTRVTEIAEFTPDLWLDFRIATATRTIQVCLFIEVDMDTYTSRERFQKKIAAYCEFLNSDAYWNRFHTTSIGIAYLTPKGEARRDEMKEWCEQQLRYTPVWHPQYYTFGQQTAGSVDTSLFLFGAIPPGALNPIDTFLSSLASAPFDELLHPLIHTGRSSTKIRAVPR